MNVTTFVSINGERRVQQSCSPASFYHERCEATSSASPSLRSARSPVSPGGPGLRDDQRGSGRLELLFDLFQQVSSNLEPPREEVQEPATEAENSRRNEMKVLRTDVETEQPR